MNITIPEIRVGLIDIPEIKIGIIGIPKIKLVLIIPETNLILSIEGIIEFIILGFQGSLSHHHPSVERSLAKYYQKHNNTDYAVKHLKKTLTKQMKHLEHRLFELGLALQESADTPETIKKAISTYKIASMIDTNNNRALYKEKMNINMSDAVKPNETYMHYAKWYALCAIAFFDVFRQARCQHEFQNYNKAINLYESLINRQKIQLFKTIEFIEEILITEADTPEAIEKVINNYKVAAIFKPADANEYIFTLSCDYYNSENYQESANLFKQILSSPNIANDNKINFMKSLAANKLAVIYAEGKLGKINIGKAIEYYKIAYYFAPNTLNAQNLESANLNYENYPENSELLSEIDDIEFNNYLDDINISSVEVSGFIDEEYLITNLGVNSNTSNVEN